MKSTCEGLVFGIEAEHALHATITHLWVGVVSGLQLCLERLSLASRAKELFSGHLRFLEGCCIHKGFKLVEIACDRVFQLGKGKPWQGQLLGGPIITHVLVGWERGQTKRQQAG